MSPRPYDMGRRRELVDDTRARILQATRDLLVAEGTVAMNSIARRADVSRATVYYQFGTKLGLLEALCDDLAERGRMQRLAEAFSQPDARVGLRIFVEVIAGFWAVDRDCTRRLRGLAAVDPDVGQVIAARDERRRAGAAVLAARLGVRPEFSSILYTLSSFEVFDSLAADQPITTATATIQALLDASSTPPPTESPD
ncbi:TetR family transcriptional regulator [Nocardia sp. SYP-A9097]|uniref:TetR/AcrR family transcriptional regulator n=1 Tax=Nocardia sp. SYP-A9097 TaxID=2663237 RepID=UPI00129A4E9A|nr:TetR/AcrR family transcriptional regulator [Nocardia sp. SYP-A9097]MRH90268.1 TetR family transcriptional regulator [Nocardia sp. SYP-A9097]